MQQRLEEALPLLNRLEILSDVAKKEGKEGQQFTNAVDAFRYELHSRIVKAKTTEPLPKDLKLLIESLQLWVRDPGELWGEHKIAPSPDLTLVMTAPEIRDRRGNAI